MVYLKNLETVMLSFSWPNIYVLLLDAGVCSGQEISASRSLSVKQTKATNFLKSSCLSYFPLNTFGGIYVTSLYFFESNESC